ncbi:hypothetical protein [Anabaena sp. 54]|jgi:hypothetical protein|uniref:hypothetical protein n=1 Tax=Anabaena sp. 54 TaxID=46231 RepID=UPI0025C3F47C|nr:hypothetical protein [Anabaena sp. 54]MBO1065130.1 hypothetical protein [Anabaena sp. 54]
MNLEQKNDQYDIEQLTLLTPFDKKVYKNKINFKSGGLFVESNVLESAEPLEPWINSQENNVTLS